VFGTLKTNCVARFSDLIVRENAILVLLLISIIILGVSYTFVGNYVTLPLREIVLLNDFCVI